MIHFCHDTWDLQCTGSGLISGGLGLSAFTIVHFTAGPPFMMDIDIMEYIWSQGENVIFKIIQSKIMISTLISFFFPTPSTCTVEDTTGKESSVHTSF